MRQLSGAIMGTAAWVLLASTAGAQGAKPLTKCAPDAVVAGSVCIDTYEASVWRVPNPTGANKGLVKKIQQGKAAIADLAKGGATQLGTTSADYAPCADTGQNCAKDIYAVSLVGVTPSAYVTWFQAQEACANSGKRLPTSAEWQVAANGSPDPGGDNGTTDCNTGNTLVVASTGSRASCVSARGAFDMVGNLDEWVMDWVPHPTSCTGWGPAFSGDRVCLSSPADNTYGPGALLRGGGFTNLFGLTGGADAGPLAVIGIFGPDSLASSIGFRCAR